MTSNHKHNTTGSTPSRATTLTAAMTAGICLNILVTPAHAQHSDIELGYLNGMIEVEFGPEGRVIEGEFPSDDIFEQFTEDPGFATNDAESLVTAPFDAIDYNILGPLTYHNGTAFAPVTPGVQIEIFDQPNGGIAVDNSTTGPVTGTGVVAQANADGDIHAHIGFELQPNNPDDSNDPPVGAYGLLTSLTTDNPAIADSEPFYLVFNFGLDDTAYESAVGAFSDAVPEPSTLLVTSASALALLVRRRRSLL